jgi:hypothetical protein
MNITNFIPGQPILSWILALISGMLVLYFIRPSAHQLLDNLTTLIIQNLRLLSRSLSLSAKRMSERNKEVLLEHGKQQAERELERQFIRLGKLVEKDLSHYPTVQRNIEHNISAMEEKLTQTSVVPAPLPEWTEAVESITKLKDSTKNDAVVGKLLQAIYEAFHTQQKEVMSTYKKDISQRHNLLKSAMQHWRHLLDKLSNVESHWQHLNDQAKKIDLQIERFDNMIKGTDKAERLLKSSNSTQFFISLVVMAIAGFGAFVNYNLIALPMSELMPATSQVAGYNVADIGAAVIIMLELTVGLFFMEAIGITRLFPVIHFMEDKKRMIWACVCMIFLLALCFVEAGLAYMREAMVADKALLTSFLVAGNESAQAAPAETSNIPMIGQMTLGFVLPLILMFVAIPFESFIHTGRHALGSLVIQLFVLSSTLLRSASLFLKQFTASLKNIYDIFCFAPLWLEHLVDHRPASSNASLKITANDQSERIAAPTIKIAKDDSNGTQHKNKEA